MHNAVKIIGGAALLVAVAWLRWLQLRSHYSKDLSDGGLRTLFNRHSRH